MKLENREAVQSTTAVIYIGHRSYNDKKSGQKKVSKKWHAEWNYLGRKFHEPLRTANKKIAIGAAWKIIQRLERGEEREVRQRVDWDDMKSRYIERQRQKGRAPKTVEKYEYVLGQFIGFAKSRGRSIPAATTSDDYWAFFDKMDKDELALKTRCDRLTIVKQWFKWANQKVKPRLLATNPLASEEVPEAPPTPQPCFTPEQVAMLLAKADTDHEGPIFAVMAYLGLRFGEVRDLMWADFNFKRGNHGWVTIQRGGSSETTKGRAVRRIPIHAELRSMLDKRSKREGGRVFSPRPSKKYPDGDGVLNQRRLLLSLKRLCRRCGFENPNQYKLHTFRHAFASMLARFNVSYKYALAFMGHKDSDILDLYYTMFDTTAESAIASIQYGAFRAA